METNGKILNVSRRDFLKVSAASMAALSINPSGLYAAGDDEIKVGLIGCGGRGSGALGQFIEAAKMLNTKVKVVALADPRKDNLDKITKRHDVPVEMAFSGFDGYKKVIASDVQYVILGTSPNFRPVHLEAAIDAGKNVFMEKPVCVDPQGCRRVIAAGEKAKEKKLAIVAGTQRRHQKPYRETAAKIEQGAIGPIRSARVWWCGGALWKADRQAGESDAMYMVRNWVSFAEMSGDHIVEQHVHNLDVANWFIGRTPIQALGFGGRARRKTGDQFDFFSIDYDYGDDLAIHSMCRQINNTAGTVAEFFVGANGSTWGDGNKMKAIPGKTFDIPKFPDGDPYVIEHFDLITSVREGKPLNEAKTVAESTLTAIMGRISAYTGQTVRWSDLMTNDKSPYYNIRLTPSAEDFEKGDVKAPADEVAPVPGKD
jgi:myo-inositol 2-dehydrogenase / D-chiro-inositol 1-dehydrogenase